MTGSGAVSSSKLSMEELEKYIANENANLEEAKSSNLKRKKTFPKQQQTELSFGEKYAGGRLGLDLNQLVLDYHG